MRWNGLLQARMFYVLIRCGQIEEKMQLSVWLSLSIDILIRTQLEPCKVEGTPPPHTPGPDKAWLLCSEVAMFQNTTLPLT